MTPFTILHNFKTGGTYCLKVLPQDLLWDMVACIATS